MNLRFRENKFPFGNESAIRQFFLCYWGWMTTSPALILPIHPRLSLILSECLACAFDISTATRAKLSGYSEETRRGTFNENDTNIDSDTENNFHGITETDNQEHGKWRNELAKWNSSQNTKSFISYDFAWVYLMFFYFNVSIFLFSPWFLYTKNFIYINLYYTTIYMIYIWYIFYIFYYYIWYIW